MPAPSDDLIQETVDRFWETFPPVWNAVRSNVRSFAVQQFNITVEQFHILRYIRKGSNSTSELAAIGRISRPAISQAVDALVNKGLVTRQQGADDRRYVRLALTREGSDLLEKIFTQTRQWMTEKFSTLNTGDLEAIMHGLTVLKEAIEVPQE